MTKKDSNTCNEDRLKKLEEVRADLDRQFGKGTLMRLGEQVTEGDAIGTGSILLDEALGIGGYPRGRVIEIFGSESAGKTTLALHAIASVQGSGGYAAFIDAEHALDPSYARKLGVNTDELWISQPDNGEQALEIACVLAANKAVDLIVIDSVAALTPQAEIEGDMGDSHMGLQARLMSQAMRKLTAILSKSRTTIIFINQLRMKIGVMFGNPETTTGGNALRFYSSVRLDVRRVSPIKKGEDQIGNRIRIKVVKNKVAPPFRTVETDLLFGRGIYREAEILDLGLRHGVISQTGSWFSFDGEKIGNGREKTIAFLSENPDLCAAVLGRIMAGEETLE